MAPEPFEKKLRKAFPEFRGVFFLLPPDRNRPASRGEVKGTIVNASVGELIEVLLFIAAGLDQHYFTKEFLLPNSDLPLWTKRFCGILDDLIKFRRELWETEE